MRKQLLSLFLSFTFTVFLFCLTSCDDDDKPKTIPEVTTGEVTAVTTTSATAAGTITSEGNAAITSRGVVYSNSNNAPTTSDSKAESSADTNEFAVLLESLASGTTFHVRAFAINEVGTAYGETVDFTTGNAAPTATNVTVTGTVRVNETLSAAYTYADAEGNAESGSTFQWYAADNGSGTGEIAINEATTLTYKLKPSDEFKFIRFGVTPKSTTGSITGTEVRSSFSGPVAEAASITFTYNGAEVTYGIITSSVTGRKWLDRNLGAPNVPAAWDDWANFGDLYQWGRVSDGHQLITRASTQAGTLGVNGTQNSKSSSDNPGHALFILPPVSPRDWRDPQNNNLWQNPTNLNNPCPIGWHIPTKDEWLAENLSSTGNIQNAFSQLKITVGGVRSWTDGGFVNTSSGGYYWSSTSNVVEGLTGQRTFVFTFGDGGVSEPIIDYQVRAYGHSCKCIKN